jgi:hypothetical protein
MIYLKAAAVGLASAVIFAVGWFWAAIYLPAWWDIWHQPGGGIGASSVGSGSALVAAIIVFALGFSWTARSDRSTTES